MIDRRAAVALLVSPLLLTGCGGGAEATERRTPATRTTPAATPTPTSEPVAESAPRRIAGLGPKIHAAIPDRSRQAVVVTGRGRNSPLSTVVLHERTATGWQAGTEWPACNALRGWSAHHSAGDLRSPLGVHTHNRRPGTSPLDWTRPLGLRRGGGVWFHVDHGGPAHGCVSVAKAHMKDLLRTPDPDRHPVVVMGYAGRLAL
ncbi:hypothetical protein [Streptomyces sp. NPDC001450]